MQKDLNLIPFSNVSGLKLKGQLVLDLLRLDCRFTKLKKLKESHNFYVFIFFLFQKMNGIPGVPGIALGYPTVPGIYNLSDVLQKNDMSELSDQVSDRLPKTIAALIK